jgi:hypothetical protein
MYYNKKGLAIISLGLVFIFSSSLVRVQADAIDADKFFSETDVKPSDEFTVNIPIKGWSAYSHEVIPFDAVLIIDKSYSMTSDYMNMVKLAAIRFVEMARDASVTAVEKIQIGLVVLSTTENTKVDHPMSDTYSDLITTIDGISRETELTGTDIAGAMSKAQEMLVSSSSKATRIVLLLTDGEPAPPSDRQRQKDDIYGTLLPEAYKTGIQYYPVALGPSADVELVIHIAGKTDGDYNILEEDPGLLPSIYSEIFNDVAHTAITHRIILKERVDISVVEIIPGTGTLSKNSYPVIIEDWRQELLDEFADTGEIDLPLGTLSENENITFTFKVRTLECLPPDAEEQSIKIYPNRQESRITYFYGQVPGTFDDLYEFVNCHKPPWIYADKDFDNETNEVVLYIKNMSSHYTIRDVNIIEIPSEYFQCEVDSVTPEPTKFIPGGVVDWLYWDVGDLAPEDDMEFRFKVTSRAYMPRDGNPLNVNYDKKWPSTVRFVLPEGEKGLVFFPQKYISVATLETIPEGRPDLHLEPAYSIDDFWGLWLPEQYDLWRISEEVWFISYLRSWMNHTFLINWFWSVHHPDLLEAQESPDIWIDSKDNGYVSNWTPINDPQVISDIKAHQNKALFGDNGFFTGRVIAQGDLFYLHMPNRVYVKIRCTGGPSPAIFQGLKLFVFNYVDNAWEPIRKRNLPPIESGTESILHIELPASLLKETHHLSQIPNVEDPSYAPYDNVYMTKLRIELVPSPTEKHTNNNVSTEEIIVIR